MSLLETAWDGVPKRRGKVRDVYDLGDRLLLVATDRISAYDWVLPNGIPGKGEILTGLSVFWFRQIDVDHHMISTDVGDAGLDPLSGNGKAWYGRSMVVKKADVIPFECVVRGYLSGSAWREYRASGTVCGTPLPPGLVESDRIDPIFTPATKADVGHDENVPFATMARELGADLAGRLRELSLHVYAKAADHARGRGLILADTKFEWGFDRQTGKLLAGRRAADPRQLAVLAPGFVPPGGPPAFVRQAIRARLARRLGVGQGQSSPPLPDDVVEQTRRKYVEAYETLTGGPFPRRLP